VDRRDDGPVTIRAPIPDLAPGDRSLRGAVAHYLGRVLRLRPGDAFVAFDPKSAREADATTLRVDDGAFVARFGPLRDGVARAARERVWIQGLAKGDKCDAVVRDATELGATRILVVTTRRSVVKLDAARAAERQARWTRIAEQAARQCGRSDAPRIDPPCPWAEAIERVNALEPEAGKFVLWERAVEPLAPALFTALAREAVLAFACGPEGGLEEAEVDAARTLGWAVCSLGPLALRTETVAAAVLGAVRVWSGL
jgi:16S rRNA (uracil1498-N3)-methyltransferase